MTSQGGQVVTGSAIDDDVRIKVDRIAGGDRHQSRLGYLKGIPDIKKYFTERGSRASVDRYGIGARGGLSGVDGVAALTNHCRLKAFIIDGLSRKVELPSD